MSEPLELIKNCVPLSLAKIEMELNKLFKQSVGNLPNPNSLPAPLITTITPNIISANSTAETFNIEGVSLSESITAIITIYQNSEKIASTPTNEEGIWTYPITLNTLKEGDTYSYFATTQNSNDATSVSPYSNTITIKKQSTSTPELEDPPTFEEPEKDTVLDITDPIILGMAIKNRQVQFQVKTENKVIRNLSLLSNNKGNWEYYFSTPLPDGVYDLTVSYPLSSKSNSIRITIETVSPIKPTITTQNATVLDSSPLVIKGRYKPNSSVKLYTNQGVAELGTIPVNNKGDWTFTSATNPNIGTFTYYVMGDIKISSNSVTIKVISSTVKIPTITSAKAVGKIVTLIGTADANNKISIYRNDSFTLRSLISETSNWKYTSQELPDGNYTFYVTATNEAGRVSSKSETKTISINTAIPTAPVINMTNGVAVNPPTILGSAQAGTTIQIWKDNVVWVNSVITSTSGVWKYIHSDVLNPKTYKINAYAINPSGIKSLISNDVNLIIESSPTPSPTPTPAPIGNTLSICINNFIQDLDTKTASVYSGNVGGQTIKEFNKLITANTVSGVIRLNTILLEVENYVNTLIKISTEDLIQQNNKTFITSSRSKDLYPVLIPSFYESINVNYVYVNDVNPDGLYRELLQLKYTMLLSTLDLVLVNQLVNLSDNIKIINNVQENIKQLVAQHQQKLNELQVKHKQMLDYVKKSPEIPKLPQIDTSLKWSNILYRYQAQSATYKNKNIEGLPLPSSIYYANINSNNLLNCI
jgi:Bacterial Ig-like domain